MKKEHEREIQRIQRRVYAKYQPRLWKKQQRADAVLEVIDKALTKERHRFDDATLKKLQAIKDSKLLDGEEKVVDEEVAAEYELEVEKEIGRAIKDGRLPHPDDDEELRKIKEQHAK